MPFNEPTERMFRPRRASIANNAKRRLGSPMRLRCQWEYKWIRSLDPYGLGWLE